MEFSDKEQGKKKVTEVKTFPIPYTLEENQENITINPNTPSNLSKEQIINQAFKFHSQGNIPEAAKYYQDFINKGFKDYRVFFNYGVILKSLGKLQEADLSYRKAIEIKPDFTEAHSNLGNILRDLGKSQEAQLSYKKAIEINPIYADAHYNLGNILRDLGKSQEAQLSYKKAIEINPDYADAHYNLGNILRDLGKLQEAQLSYKKAIEINPDYVDAHSNLGLILNDLGKLQEAQLSYKKAIEINPYYADAYSNLGSILKNLGKLQEAEIATRKAIEINPDYADAYSNLGSILKNLGKLQEAELSYRKAIELNPNLIENKINLDAIKNISVPLWHIPMMNDDKRNNAYLKAIKCAIKGNEYVLEIGTGSGLLSMMAIDAGAKKVTTCEASEPIAKAAKRIIAKNGFSDQIEVINKKSTELNVDTDLEKKANLIISEILSSEFVGEGVQPSLSDANRRLIQENGRMIPEGGEIKVALLESSPEVEKELFVQKVNGYDLSEFNNIMGKKLSVHYLGRKAKNYFLSAAKVPFSFNFYSKEIIKRKEILLELEASKSGICLGLITWLKLNLYEDICFENKPDETSTSGWVNPIYKFNQPLKISKGQIIRVKAGLITDKVWYELIE